MTDMVVQKNIAQLAQVAGSVRPQAAAAGTINGASIDRAKHGNALSAIMRTNVGATSGAPTSFTVQSQLQHAPDNATWTNYQPLGVNAQGAANATANADENFAVNLSSAQRFVRVQTVVAFVGGTSPTVGVAADLVLSGEDRNKAV